MAAQTHGNGKVVYQCGDVKGAEVVKRGMAILKIQIRFNEVAQNSTYIISFTRHDHSRKKSVVEVMHYTLRLKVLLYAHIVRIANILNSCSHMCVYIYSIYHGQPICKGSLVRMQLLAARNASQQNVPDRRKEKLQKGASWRIQIN